MGDTRVGTQLSSSDAAVEEDGQIQVPALLSSSYRQGSSRMDSDAFYPNTPSWFRRALQLAALHFPAVLLSSC